MMKIFMRVLLLSIVLFSFNCWAGSEINNSNHTARYFRDMSSSIDPDVIYNPAGMAFEERNSIAVGIQTIFKDYCSGNPAGCAEGVSLVPDLSVHYRYSDNLSFTGAYYIVAGGGELDFEEGNALTQAIGANFTAPSVGGGAITQQNIIVEAVYHALKAGIVYKASDNIGIAAGIMQVFGTKSIEATIGHTNTFISPQLINLNMDQDASGMTGFASIHYKPNKLWDFAANFTGPVRLDWSSDIETNSPAIETMIRKDDVREDLPAVFVLGAKRNFFTDNGNFELKTNLTYYLQSDFGVIWDDIFAVGSVDNRQESFGDGYEASLGGTWEPVNSKLKYYAGYLYSNPRADIDTTSKFKPSLVSSTLGLGLDYKLNDNVTLNFGGAATFYNTETTSGGDELSRRTYALGTGLQYHF
ncbi:MAG: hypothetical protein JRJ49_06510 [Deltaproteobacteria bacterium]|nr:hypothetical protein [Deltaproteobacteria bacterium]